MTRRLLSVLLVVCLAGGCGGDDETATTATTGATTTTQAPAQPPCYGLPEADTLPEWMGSLAFGESHNVGTGSSIDLRGMVGCAVDDGVLVVQGCPGDRDHPQPQERIPDQDPLDFLSVQGQEPKGDGRVTIPAFCGLPAVVGPAHGRAVLLACLLDQPCNLRERRPIRGFHVVVRRSTGSVPCSHPPNLVRDGFHSPAAGPIAEHEVPVRGNRSVNARRPSYEEQNDFVSLTK